MKKSARIGGALVVATIMAGVGSIPASSLAAQGDPASPGGDTPPATVTSSKVVTASATIQKINKQDSTLTLKGPTGDTFDVKAGPNVDFDKLKVGDKVTATFFEEIAVAINKHTTAPPSKMETKSVQRGGVTAMQATLTAKIVAVDEKNNSVTIRTANGDTHSLKVEDPQLQGMLKKVKAGDNVDITYTQAVATSVEPMTKK